MTAYRESEDEAFNDLVRDAIQRTMAALDGVEMNGEGVANLLGAIACCFTHDADDAVTVLELAAEMAREQDFSALERVH